MGTSLKAIATATTLALSIPAYAGGEPKYSQSLTQSYSQQELLKNWAMCACLATVIKDESFRNDLSATASAYLEFGRQRIEAYDELRKLADKYAAKRYSGSIQSEFNSMKCIDLFHSKELDRLTKKLSKAR